MITVQKQLRQEGELIDSLAKLSQLKEQGGGDKTGKGGGSSGGLKNTLKKIKPTGKKKRQRNSTAPEISAEALKGLKKEQAQKPSKDGGAGRGLFGKKTSKEKEGGSPSQKKSESDVPRESPERQMAIPAIKEEERVMQEPVSSVDDGWLSQKSEIQFSEYARDPSAPIPSLPHSKTDPAITYHTDLSQVSLSSSIPEEALSTQSSFEAVPLEQLAPPSRGHPEAGSGGGSQDAAPGESDVIVGEEGERGEEGEKDFRKGCPSLYDDYGDEQHKLNLKHVLKFLESCNETSPVDLGSLVDWDGWTLASKELMLVLNTYIIIMIIVVYCSTEFPGARSHSSSRI